LLLDHGLRKEVTGGPVFVTTGTGERPSGWRTLTPADHLLRAIASRKVQGRPFWEIHMNNEHADRRTGILPWAALLAILALVVVVVSLAAMLVIRPSFPGSGGMMFGGPPGAGAGQGMMGGGAVTQPGQAGFVGGTVAAPRVVHIVAGPGYAFSLSTVAVARGETVTFVVTVMGRAVHEFMVGPADAVAADQAGTPEVADIGMMQSRLLTYTFDGSGPYAFACHAEGHYEAGMHGTITVVG
jgi:uncharacterized cupredoxin-like copper-binding protein